MVYESVTEAFDGLPDEQQELVMKAAERLMTAVQLKGKQMGLKMALETLAALSEYLPKGGE
jgi:hypothetical protein